MERNSLNSSFTLIELLITVTIIFIFSGLSIASYNNFTQNQQLKNEAKKFIDVLELARKKSIAGDLSNRNCDNFNGYQIKTFANNNQNPDYQLSICCNSSCTQIVIIKSYTIPDNINFQSENTFRFWPLSAKLNPPNDLTLTLKNQSVNKCLQITINKFGVINLNETLTSC